MAPSVSEMLELDCGVAPQYQHGPKLVAPGTALEGSGRILKWYAIHAADRPVPDELTNLARLYLTTQATLEAQGFGFVLLHRCGNDFYFLIVSTWRNNNELWETVFYKDGEGMADFAPFPREGAHKPTFCVWEMVPLWHEQKAWERFLMSRRDRVAAELWLGDTYAGSA